jgi:hypothetical protein
VTPETTGLTQKNSDRLRPFDNPETFEKLINLPFVMRAQVEKGRLSPVRAAQQSEMAVAIAILLIAPIRIKNLRQIEIGRQLRTHGQRMMLSFVEEEVKNAVPLEFEIDAATAELITWYIDRHRPLLAPQGSLFLFPGTDGLIHISELSDKRVAKVSDVVQEGDEVVVKVLSIDRDGKIRLSRRAAIGKEVGTIDKSEPPPRDRPAPRD